MKKLFLFAMLAAFISVGQQHSFAQQSADAPKAFKVLQRDDIDALLATPGRVLVLDVRSPGEMAYWGTFPVYLNIETAEGDTKALDLEKHLSEVPKDREIITVSGGANRAGFAAALLASRGFKVDGAVSAIGYAKEGGYLTKYKPYTHWSMNGGKPPAGVSPTASRDEPKSFKELHKADVEALMAAPDRVFVVDVRSPGEIAYWGGFPVYLDVQSEEGDTSARGIENHLADIPKDKPIITVSGRANRSGFAAALLEKNGYKVLGAVGAMTLGEEGYQFVKDPPYKPPTPKQ